MIAEDRKSWVAVSNVCCCEKSIPQMHFRFSAPVRRRQTLAKIYAEEDSLLTLPLSLSQHLCRSFSTLIATRGSLGKSRICLPPSLPLGKFVRSNSSTFPSSLSLFARTVVIHPSFTGKEIMSTRAPHARIPPPPPPPFSLSPHTPKTERRRTVSFFALQSVSGARQSDSTDLVTQI